MGLVGVAVKAPDHLNALMPVIEAGKDIFVEWPAGAGLEQTKMIADAARKKGTRTFIGLQGRHSLVIRKVKEIIESGKIGAIRSSIVYAMNPREFAYYPPKVIEAALYANDPKNGATVLHIAVGHNLDTFTHVLGDFSSISATATTAYPTATIVSPEGVESETFQAQTPDHYAISGVLKSGAIVSLTWRSGIKSVPGRRSLLWEIEGEEGSLRMESSSVGGAYINIADPDLYLNGEKVEISKPQENDEPQDPRAGNIVRAWKEYAKGEKVGGHATADDAVRIHILLDAIQRSVREEGKRVYL